jgi:photosystem II stability/assembly factor-like uncharacterized protein
MASPPIETTESTSPSVKIINVESKLAKLALSWKLEPHIGPNESLNVISFSSASGGWAVADHALYLTTDGGSTWKQSELPLSQDSCLTTAFFVNTSIGWVALHQCERDVAGEWDFLRVLKTTDGGQSWKTQYEANNAWPSALWFVNENNGWLVGSMYQRDQPFLAALVLRTIDGGRTWLDVSTGINEMIRAEVAATKSPNYDQIKELTLDEDNSLSVLTLRGSIFRTKDNGSSWQKVFTLTNEPRQSALRNLGTYGGKYFIGGGAVSVEGVWGVFLSEESPNSWFRYRLNGVSFNDVLMLPDGRLFASGAILKDKAKAPDDQTDGVILHSKDTGRTWQMIYRNTSIRSINSLATNTTGAIWVAGDRGFIGRLAVSK